MTIYALFVALALFGLIFLIHFEQFVGLDPNMGKVHFEYFGGLRPNISRMSLGRSMLNILVPWVQIWAEWASEGPF